MSEILRPDFSTTVPEPVDQVLDKAKSWGVDKIVIVGMTEGGEFITGGNFSDTAEILLMLRVAEADLVDTARIK